MTVLTKDMKVRVLKRAVEFGMAKDVAALKAAKTKLADDFYEATFGVESANMEKQPGAKNWLHYGNELYLSAEKGAMFNSNHRVEKFDYMHSEVRLRKDRPMPVAGTVIRINPDEPFYTQGLDLFKRHQKNWKKREAMEEKVRALLATVTTFKQFADAWPDGARFLPPEPVKTRALITTTHVAELNAVIGLPPEDEVVAV